MYVPGYIVFDTVFYHHLYYAQRVEPVFLFSALSDASVRGTVRI